MTAPDTDTLAAYCLAHEGEWVRYSDHAAEIARLTAERDKWKAAWEEACKQWQGECKRIMDERDQQYLRAEKAEAALSESQALLAAAYEVARLLAV